MKIDNSKILDIKYLDNIVKHYSSKTNLITLFEVFEITFNTELDKINKQLKQDIIDIDKIQKIAHKLKGGAGTIGATALHDQLSNYKNTAQLSDNARALIDETNELYNITKAAISTYLTSAVGQGG